MNKTKEKKPLLKRWWVWVVAVLVIYVVFNTDVDWSDTDEVEAEAVEKVEKVEKEKPKKEKPKEVKAGDKELLFELADELVEATEGVVMAVDFEAGTDTGNQMRVTVSDVWYDSPEHEKERFAESVGNTVKQMVAKSGFNEYGDIMVVHIYDGHDKRVAKQSMVSGKYKIEK